MPRVPKIVQFDQANDPRRVAAFEALLTAWIAYLEFERVFWSTDRDDIAERLVPITALVLAETGQDWARTGQQNDAFVEECIKEWIAA